MGGSLSDFIQYVSNPTFGCMVHCSHYSILNIGPIIPRTNHRGAMQTILVEIEMGMTVHDAVTIYNEAQTTQDYPLSSSSPISTTSTTTTTTASTAARTSPSRPSGRPTIAERKRARHEQRSRSSSTITNTNSSSSSSNKNKNNNKTTTTNNKRVYLWTMQQERRPTPHQHCWLIHEVLHQRYSFLQTTRKNEMKENKRNNTYRHTHTEERNRSIEWNPEKEKKKIHSNTIPPNSVCAQNDFFFFPWITCLLLKKVDLQPSCWLSSVDHPGGRVLRASHSAIFCQELGPSGEDCCSQGVQVLDHINDINPYPNLILQIACASLDNV